MWPDGRYLQMFFMPQYIVYIRLFQKGVMCMHPFITTIENIIYVGF